MNLKAHSSPRPVQPGPEKSIEPDSLDQAAPDVAIRQARNAFRASVTFLVAAAIAFIGELYLAVEVSAWQVYVLAGIGALLTCTAAISLYFVRQNRPVVGIRLLIAASLLSVLVAPFLVAGVGLILGLGTTLLVLTIALQTLPQSEANWVLLVSVGVAVVAGAIDLLAPGSQLVLTEFRNLILILGGLMILVSGTLMIQQFSAYPLTTKLILAFLIVSLLPLGLSTLLNDMNTREVLIMQARQSLSSAASKTAADIDAFITDNLDTIRTEAQLPVLITYLKLPAEARFESAEETAVIDTLAELSRKDKVFILSYALLDTHGLNLVDTQAPYTAQDESAHTYFQKPLGTGLPYVSDIEFSPLTEAEEPQPAEKAALYFSSPVRDPMSGEHLGVLRVHYEPNILQQLVVTNNNLVGQESFAILFDENYVRLAHGTAPDLIFKTAGPLEPDQLAALQQRARLPAGTQADLSTNLPDLTAGLNNAIFEPNFSTRLIPTGDKVNLVVVKELETQPWIVIFAQPEEVFLAPIQDQTRTALFLAIAIAGVVTAAAFTMGRFLANPLVHLTRVVTQFTAGDLEARAQAGSGDEIGVLAASFNTMAAQVGKLLTSLAVRTQELEAEIGERRRAEANLQASEEKYRRIFEDSHDVIFIAASDGHIIDINPTASTMFGYPIAELKQMKMQRLYVNPKHHTRFQRQIDQTGSVRDFEVEFVTNNQALRDCLITATIRHDRDGAHLGYQGIIRDITEQKQAEKERLRLVAIEQELTLAQEIQRSLLPPAQPSWHGPRVVCYSIPAREMGGDLYAYYELNDHCFAVSVGDVSGKGMPAALLMAVSVASIQAAVGQGLRPSALLTHLDQAIAPYTRETGQNCALVYVEISLNEDSY
ncbi:MAG: PAS domain S-box protein, partial [Anaerolineae bacterium]|nr:PAS domain S-box protein [Anaerolineae bacterium]